MVGAGTVSMGWAYFLGSVMETLGSTLLSGNVIKKLVAGIINIQAYQSNRTEEMLKFEQGQAYLINENMLLIGKLSLILYFLNGTFGILKHDTEISVIAMTTWKAFE